MKHLLNQCVQIRLKTPKDAYDCYVIFLSNSIRMITTPPDQPIQASISGSVGSFLGLLLSRDPRFAAQHGLSVEGDPQTLLYLEQRLSTIGIDWAEFISKFTGDSLAHGLEQTFKKHRKNVRQFCKNGFHQVIDYLTDDQQCLAPKPLLNRFLDDVDEFRAAVDRLDAQLQHTGGSA